MNLETLQQMYSIKVNNKQLLPRVTIHFLDMYYIRYDLDDNHLQFAVTEKNLYNRLYLAGIRRNAVEWAEEIEKND